MLSAYSGIRKRRRMLFRKYSIKLWNMGNKLDEYQKYRSAATTMIKNFRISISSEKKAFHREESRGKRIFIARRGRLVRLSRM